MSLLEAEIGKEYSIRDIQTEDRELTSFLFSLGFYTGENITVVSRRKKNSVVSVKDARYSIDNALAETIIV